MSLFNSQILAKLTQQEAAIAADASSHTIEDLEDLELHLFKKRSIDDFDKCPCPCHDNGEPYCGNCFEDHVIPGLKEVREID